MEVFVPCNTSRCPDIISSHGSLTTDPHSIFQNKSKDLSMSDLKTCLTDILNGEENGVSTSGFNLAPAKNGTCNVVRESEYDDLDKSTSGKRASEKCLSKCATFPPLRVPTSSGDVVVGEKGKSEEDITSEVSEGDGSAKPFRLSYSRSMSLPVPLKSAMKGSREKQRGTSSSIDKDKLSVTWAPDVYDPVPTSVSHVPSDRNQRYRSKKYGKYKQKSGGGKSSRGSNSKSKDKKQGRRSSSNKLKQPFRMDNGVVLGEPRVGALDYNVGRPDPFCGTSFLKESVTKLHFSVAEAT